MKLIEVIECFKLMDHVIHPENITFIMEIIGRSDSGHNVYTIVTFVGSDGWEVAVVL